MTVRTVLGDVAAASLGPTLMHEHVILDSPLIESDHSHIHLPSVDEASDEVALCVAEGFGAMVDAMPAGGRDPLKLKQVSERTGVSVIATSGLHTEKYYTSQAWALDIDVPSLAQVFVDDTEVGLDRYDHRGPIVERTDVRAGLIKVATDEAGMTERAGRLFEAATEAAMRSGVAILTHTEQGRGALDQIERFVALGFPLHRVVISHTDKVTDESYHTDILASGVSVEYDQAIRRSKASVNATAALTAEMVRKGYVRQIMFGTDGARRSLWSTLGGEPGLAYMGRRFRTMLKEVGVSEADIDAMYIENPRRFLTIAEKAA